MMLVHQTVKSLPGLANHSILYKTVDIVGDLGILPIC